MLSISPLTPGLGQQHISKPAISVPPLKLKPIELKPKKGCIYFLMAFEQCHYPHHNATMSNELQPWQPRGVLATCAVLKRSCPDRSTPSH